MYIEIESAERAIPQISFKRERQSNVIKKSELRIYSDAQSLLDSLRARVDEYQLMLEQQVLHLIEEKEKSLNTYIDLAFGLTLESWNGKQCHWLTQAESKLDSMLLEQSQMLNVLKDEIKHSVVTAVQSRLNKLSQCEGLVQYLVDILHTEIEDEAKSLKVDKVVTEEGVALSIENDEKLICISTTELMAQLKKSLEEVG